MRTSKNSLKKVFKLIDVDNNGAIDFEEFSIFFAKAPLLQEDGGRHGFRSAIPRRLRPGERRCSGNLRSRRCCPRPVQPSWTTGRVYLMLYVLLNIMLHSVSA